MRLPYGICDTPKPGKNEEHVGLVGGWGPLEEDDDDDDVDESAHDEDWDPAGVLDDHTEGQRTDCVENTVRYEHVANIVNTDGARDETLRYKGAL